MTTKARLDREIRQILDDDSKGPAPRSRTKRQAFGAALPAATLEQRIASMSTAELMEAARALARKTDAASDRACTAVLEALEARAPGPSFDVFVAEIYS